MQPLTLDTLSTELQDMVLVRLTRYDFTQCALVNKAWRDLVTPHIWRTIAIQTFDHFQKFKTPEAQTALTRNAWMVHHLHIRFAGVLECFARPLSSSATSTFEVICTNLRTLCARQVVIEDPKPPFQFQLHSPTPPPKPEPLRQENPQITDLNLQGALCALIKSNPDLQHLAAGQNGIGVHKTLDREPLLQVLTAEYLPKLEVLELLVLSNTPPRALKDLLERCSERIKRIQIQRAYEPMRYGLQVITPPNDASELPARGHVCLDHSALESLHVHIAMNGPQEYILLDFLRNRRSKNLREISTGVEQHWYFKNICRALDDPALLLHIRGPLEDSVLASVIAREDPPWKHIDLSDSDDKFGAEGTAALLHHCQALEFLDISHCRDSINSAMYQSLLCRATRLVEFRAACNEPHAAGWDPVLLGTDVGVLPWGCTRLKIFQGEIGGIPRPDVTVNELLLPVEGQEGALYGGTTVESDDVHRQVYQQLGAMTDLEELHLGHDDRDWGFKEMYWTPDVNGECRYRDDKFQLNCLEMTLESGLGALEGLKKLRVLDVRRMAHRVGVQELEWMQENWPRLEAVRGLIHRYYPYQTEVEEWLEKHKPKWARFYSHKQMFDGVVCYRTAIEYP